MLSETDPTPCINCGQLLLLSAKSGRPINFADGVGGFRGNDHICPNRIGSQFHRTEPKEINYWTHKHDRYKGDCPFNVPEWVKLHYYSITRLGKCFVENCPCIEIDKMKDPKIKKEWDNKREAWIAKYGK